MKGCRGLCIRLSSPACTPAACLTGWRVWETSSINCTHCHADLAWPRSRRQGPSSSPSCHQEPPACGAPTQSTRTEIVSLCFTSPTTKLGLQSGSWGSNHSVSEADNLEVQVHMCVCIRRTCSSVAMRAYMTHLPVPPREGLSPSSTILQNSSSSSNDSTACSEETQVWCQ